MCMYEIELIVSNGNPQIHFFLKKKFRETAITFRNAVIRKQTLY